MGETYTTFLTLIKTTTTTTTTTKTADKGMEMDSPQSRCYCDIINARAYDDGLGTESNLSAYPQVTTCRLFLIFFLALMLSAAVKIVIGIILKTFLRAT